MILTGDYPYTDTDTMMGQMRSAITQGDNPSDAMMTENSPICAGEQPQWTAVESDCLSFFAEKRRKFL